MSLQFGGSAPKVAARSYRLGVIGTSLVNDNDQAVTGPTVQTLSYGWLRWAEFYAQGLFTSPVWLDPAFYAGWEPGQVVGATRGFQGLNAGVSGQSPAQIAARLGYLADGVDCDVVLLDWGATNGINLDRESLRVAMETAVDFYLSRGKIVVLLSTLIRSATAWADPALRNKAYYLNAVSREFVRRRRNCFLFDWNEVWVDPVSATGGPRAGFSRDGTHFAPMGAEAIGKALAAFLKTILPAGFKRVTSQADIFEAVNNPRGNIMANPFCLGTGGTASAPATGQVANGMSVVRSSGGSTVAASKEARQDRGEWQVLTFTPGGAAVDVFHFRPTAQYTAHGLAAGDWVQASIEVATNDYAGFESVSLQLSDHKADNGTLSTAIGMRRINGQKWAGQAREGCILTPPLQLGVGSASLRMRAQIEFDAAVAGAPVVKIGAVEVRKVEDPRVALNWKAPNG